MVKSVLCPFFFLPLVHQVNPFPQAMHHLIWGRLTSTLVPPQSWWWHSPEIPMPHPQSASLEHPGKCLKPGLWLGSPWQVYPWGHICPSRVYTLCPLCPPRPPQQHQVLPCRKCLAPEPPGAFLKHSPVCSPSLLRPAVLFLGAKQGDFFQSFYHMTTISNPIPSSIPSPTPRLAPSSCPLDWSLWAVNKP